MSDSVEIEPDASSREAFGASLTRLRESRGLTVRGLARAADVPLSTVGDYMSGTHLPSAGQLDRFRAILRACGVDEPVLTQTWTDALGSVRTLAVRRGPRQPSPYPGLESFDITDADRFFGRTDETETVLAMLLRLDADPTPSGGILAVVGPSGSGKSSLLRAGVAAAIGGGDADGPDEQWECAVVTPGSDPSGSLDAALTALSGAGRGVVVLDQFEEVFTAVADPAVRSAFLRRLADVAGGRALVVLGLRADFYAAATQEPVLLPALQHAQVVVGPLTAEHLRDAIVAPAERAGSAVEDGLVDLLLADLSPHDAPGHAHDAGALPLLSHALLATWERSDGERLTVADYRGTGGIDGAIQRTAEQLYAELTPPQQQLAQRVFVRLVHLDDIAVTRRRVSRSELAHLESAGADVESLIARFVDARLLTASQTLIEISHEALLTAWPRLHEWVDADRAGLRQHRQITNAAGEWQQSDREPSLLMRGGLLAATLHWVESDDHVEDLTTIERDYIDAARAQRDADRALARSRQRRLRRLLTVAVILAVAAGGLAVYALHSRARAAEAQRAAALTRDDALSRQVAFQARELQSRNPALAEQLALVAYRIAHTPVAAQTILDETAQAPITRVLGVQGPTPLGLSRDGLTIAVGHASDGSVHLYRRRTGAAPVPIGTVPGPKPVSQPFAVTFAPDASFVAIGGSDGVVRLWRIADPAHPVALATLSPHLGGAVESIAISPDGRTLAASSAGTSPVLEWDISTPSARRALPSPTGLPANSTVQSVVFGPHGTTLAAGGGDLTSSYVATWPAARPGRARPALVRGDANALINSVAYTPDGAVLVAGTSAGVLHVYSASRLEQLRQVSTTGDAKINAVAISPDGARIAAGAADGATYEFDLGSLTELTTTANPGPVTGLTYAGAASPSLLSTTADGTLRLVAVQAVLPSVGTVYNMNYSANGSRLAVVSAGTARGIQLWDTRSPTHPVTLAPLTAQLLDDGANSGTGALSPNGRLLAAGTKTGRVALYDVSNPRAPRLVAAPSQVLERDNLVESFAFAPDGSRLAVAGDDDTVRLLDVRTPAHPRQLGVMRGTGLMLGVAVSPDGRYVAAASADDHAYLWDVSDPARPSLAARFAFPNYVYSVAFSPDGRRLAAGSSDETARVWDISNPRRPKSLGAPFVGATDYVFAVAFSPDGRTLATGSNDGSVRLYSVAPGSISRYPTATLSGVGGSVFAVAFEPDGRRVIAAGRGTSVVRWLTSPMPRTRHRCARWSATRSPVTSGRSTCPAHGTTRPAGDCAQAMSAA